MFSNQRLFMTAALVLTSFYGCRPQVPPARNVTTLPAFRAPMGSSAPMAQTSRYLLVSSILMAAEI